MERKCCGGLALQRSSSGWILASEHRRPSKRYREGIAIDLTVEEPPIEEIIKELYGKEVRQRLFGLIGQIKV